MKNSLQFLVHFQTLLARLFRFRVAWRFMFTLLLCVVGYLALTPTPPKQADLGWDKLNHFAAFATLAFSACMSFSVSKRNQALLALFLFAFGGAIELIQTRVPGRSCEWVDLFADTLGIGGGLLAATVILKIVRA